MISTYAYDSSDDDLIPLNKKKNEGAVIRFL